MARSNYRPKETAVKRLTPSEYGSHASMISENAMAELDRLELSRIRLVTVGDEEVEKEFTILTDEYGQYITDVDRLDTGLADPNRYDDFQTRGKATSISKANFEERQAKVTALVGVLEEEELTA